MKQIYLFSLLLLTLMVSGCSPPAPESEVAAQDSTPTRPESDSFENQVAEYIQNFAYQETYNYSLKYTGGDPAKFNVWVPGGEPVLVKAGEDIVVRTNNDTYYIGAFLYLGGGPVVVAANAPTEDRFYSFQLMDDNNVNFRNIIHPKGEYTFYFGEKPEQILGEAVEVPSVISVLAGRVEVKNKNDPEDVAAANAIYYGLTIDGTQPIEYPQLDLLSKYPADVVDEANRRIDETFSTIPISQLILRPGQELGVDLSYLKHAAVAKGAWAGPVPSHSAYETIFFDENGDELMGNKGTYTVTTGEPPVDAFWSITVYDTDRGGFFHPNDDDRYHINNTGAVRNHDGTMTFTFKQDCEVSDLNCLEVPAGRFDLATRYYLPHEEIITGEWTLSKVELHAD
jgi:hypothetical protein